MYIDLFNEFRHITQNHACLMAASKQCSACEKTGTTKAEIDAYRTIVELEIEAAIKVDPSWELRLDYPASAFRK